MIYLLAANAPPLFIPRDFAVDMPKSLAALTLSGLDHQHAIVFSNLNYLGHGAYSCLLQVRSNGFSCEKVFGFDNDEYFIAKINEVITLKTGDAELTDLQSDNFLKIQVFEPEGLLVTGLILEEEPLNQSLEFAFVTRYEMIERFAHEFARMVQANI